MNETQTMSNSPQLPDSQRFRVETVYDHLYRAVQPANEVLLSHFIAAYEELNKFIGNMGTLFHFVQRDVHEKTIVLNNLMEKDAENYHTVQSMIVYESTRSAKPGATALLALNRALEFIASFMGSLAIASEDTSVASICRKSYDETLSRYHNWLIRKAVHLASYTLPSRHTLITTIQSGQIPDEAYIKRTLGSVVVQARLVHQRVQLIFDEYNLNKLV